jgi:ribonucleotide reductase beta subunit family protein with ferritin-like domain
MPVENILNPSKERFNPFPTEYHTLWNFLQKQRASVWFVEEVDLSKDDLSSCNDQEKHFIKMILAFFSQFDGIINVNIGESLLKEVKIIEAQYNYRWQMSMEDIHSEMYATLIETYIDDDNEKIVLRNAVNNFAVLKDIKDWIDNRFFTEGVSFGMKLIVNAILEGIFFSAPFCLIFYLSQNNKLPGLAKSNEFISRDEGMHMDFSVLLFRELQNKPSQPEVHSLFKEAIDINKKFVHEALPCKLPGMSQEKMNEYVEFISDRLLIKLGYDKLFFVSQNPFPFMDRISLEGKNNFFESRTTEYQKPLCRKDNLKLLDVF